MDSKSLVKQARSDLRDMYKSTDKPTYAQILLVLQDLADAIEWLADELDAMRVIGTALGGKSVFKMSAEDFDEFIHKDHEAKKDKAVDRKSPGQYL